MPRRTLLAMALAAATLIAPAAAVAAPSDVVISEFRTRGPAGGNDEFIELRNVSTQTRDIGGWRVQGCNSGGTVSTRATVPTGVSLPGGGSYLVVNNNASGGYSGSVAGDLTYGTGITDTGGIRLTDATGSFQDAVGSSSVIASVNCREGDGLTLPDTNGENAFERVGGTQDTNDNVADFRGPKTADPQNAQGGVADDAPSVSGSDPANGASDVARDATIHVTFSEPVDIDASGFTLACGGAAQPATTTQDSPTSATVDPDGDLPIAESCTLTIAAGAVTDRDAHDPPDAMARNATIRFSTHGLELAIHDIQGAGHRSPYEGKIVSAVDGVVTAASSNGFWMQDTAPDADPATSEGIFVFRGSGAAVGDAVAVDGNVSEFRPGTDVPNNNLTTTEIVATKVVKTGTGTVAPTLIGPGGLTPPTAVIEDDASSSVETDGEFDPAQDGIDFHESLEGMLVEIANPHATGPRNSFGEISVVPQGFGGPFTPRGGIKITPDDFNPERLILDDVIARTPVVNAGDDLQGPVDAVVDYSFGNFKYLVTKTPERIDNHLQQEVTDPPRANQLAIASINLENLDPTDPKDKFDRLAKIVTTNLRSPDILAVEEVQDNNGPAAGDTDATETYNELIDTIEACNSLGEGLCGPHYEFRQINPENNSDGGQLNGNIRVGFLYRTDRGLQFVDRPGAEFDTPNEVVPTDKGVQLKYSPGRIDPTNTAFTDSRKPLAAEFTWKGRTVFAIANHFNSKGGDQPLFGRFQPPTRSSETQRHQQATVLAGFVSKILAADPRAAIAVMGDFNDFEFSETLDTVKSGGLTNLMETLPENERYSYVFDGNSQVLDQILVSNELLTPTPEYDSVHVNAEFADQASDHDPQIARVVVRGTAQAH